LRYISLIYIYTTVTCTPNPINLSYALVSNMYKISYEKFCLTDYEIMESR